MQTTTNQIFWNIIAIKAWLSFHTPDKQSQQEGKKRGKVASLEI
jgi:hypothetical protein